MDHDDEHHYHSLWIVHDYTIQRLIGNDHCTTEPRIPTPQRTTIGSQVAVGAMAEFQAP
jgi:hypothetical protein